MIILNHFAGTPLQLSAIPLENLKVFLGTTCYLALMGANAILSTFIISALLYFRATALRHRISRIDG